MSLGAAAATSRVIHQVAGLMEGSGGRSLASAVRQDSGLEDAMCKAQAWFAGHCCLFIFDDLWTSNDIQSDVSSKLSVLVSDCGEKESVSRLVYSTRDEALSLQGETVAFEARDSVGYESIKVVVGAAGMMPVEMEHDVSGRQFFESWLDAQAFRLRLIYVELA